MSARFKDENAKEVGELTVISRYFRKPDETMSDFQAQCKQLSSDDKTELAVGAAKLLGFERIADIA